MITFIIALLVLVGGYFLYGSYVERVFGPDKTRKTPALTMADGVDFIPLPTWKIFMIQFLNIAGLGPIFGAIMGAKFGTASYLWIVLGTIFAGAVHDYLSGMLSIRHDGESLPEIIGRYLGLPTKQLMRGFTVVLMILVGAVFVAGPAGLLAKLTPEYMDVTFWIIVVFVYYMLATLLPVDKIIGKIYPLFASFTGDLIFFVPIDTLFLTLVKGLNASQITAMTMVALIICIVFQKVILSIVKKIGNVNSLRLGATMLLIASLVLTFGKSFIAMLLYKSIHELAVMFLNMDEIILKNNLIHNYTKPIPWSLQFLQK